MEKFAVIDTETNWENQIMSIGTVIAEAETFRVLDLKYHIITPEYLVGGMYSGALPLKIKLQPTYCSKEQAMRDLLFWFNQHGVCSIFAYNATFDHNHMPELSQLNWYDIMRLAAYRQYNRKIPCTADCCSTGRLKRNYGVEPMLRLLSSTPTYHETHNALHDALDELEIMRLLEHRLEDYIPL